MSKKALLIRLSSAGDILLAAPLTGLLKKADITVHFLAKEKFREAAVLTGAHKVFGWGAGGFMGLKDALPLLNAEKYDYVIDLHSTLRSRMITSAVRCGKKARCGKQPLRRRLMVLFKWFTGQDPVPVQDRYVTAAAKVVPGLKPAERTAKKPRPGKQRVIIHLGAKWPNKRWPHYDELAVMLARLPGFSVTVTGVKDEIENYPQMRYHKNRKIRDLVGKTDFAGLVREIGKSTLFIGNDTAAAHAAILRSVPAVVFLGPTYSGFGFITGKDFNIIERKGLLCRPCHLHGGERCPIGTFECMDGIGAQEAFDRIKELAGRG